MASTHASSDPTSNRNSFDPKTERAGKKSIVSRMKGLFQPNPRKPIGEPPDGLKGFFDPVERPKKSPTSAEILSDSEYKPPTERERKYLKEPIFEKGFLHPPPVRGHTAAAATNQPSSSMSNSRVSYLKNQFEERIGKSTQEVTVEVKSRPCSRSLESNTMQIQALLESNAKEIQVCLERNTKEIQARDGRIKFGKDVELARYANTGKVEDWVQEVRTARESI